MKKILVPCDFSEPAMEAYKFALAVARVSFGEVYVLKAIDLPIMYESAFGVQPYIVDSRLLKELEDNAYKQFDKLKSQVFAEDVKASFQTAYGPVSLSIRQFITDHDIDLVVMGTHGAGGVKEYFIGSNTEKIVRTSPVPVFAIRKAPELSSIKNIVFPTTLEFNRTHLLEEIKALQEFFGATLHVLLINTPMDFRTDRDMKLVMEEFAKHYKLHDYTLNIRNDAYEMDGIIDFAKEIHANMVAMATHGRRGLLHLLTGSIAEDVVNHVSCPIWTCSLKGLKKESQKENVYEKNSSAH
jgi:nucleotide-binding universal stress UspA family protein